jgi:PKD repeat protein
VPCAAALALAPAASFLWFPAAPAAGEPVTFVSTSTDATSPIASFAWDLGGAGTFAQGGPSASTTFAVPGGHPVQLRVTNSEGVSSVVSATITVSAAVLAPMLPFPIVRYVASEDGARIRLRLLSVEAPKGTRVSVECHGRRCPARSESLLAGSPGPGTVTLTFRPFERALAPGTVLEIRVYGTGQIGKYTRIAIHRHRAPIREDACIEGLAARPVPCNP